MLSQGHQRALPKPTRTGYSQPFRNLYRPRQSWAADSKFTNSTGHAVAPLDKRELPRTPGRAAHDAFIEDDDNGRAQARRVMELAITGFRPTPQMWPRTIQKVITTLPLAWPASWYSMAVRISSNG